MSKIAIIGSSSFLAKSLVKCLTNRDHKLYGRQEASCYSFPSISFLSGFDIQQILSSEVIYYCAGQGIQPKNSDDVSLIYELNTFEPIRLINALIGLGYTGKIVTFGSYFEFGNSQNNVPFDENLFINNTNPKPNNYCISKSLLTTFVDTQIANGHQQLLHFVLPNIYGAGENKHRLFPYIVDCIAHQQHMTFSAGTQTRQFVHVDDVAEIVTDRQIQSHSGIYHLGGTTQTLKEVISEAIHALTHGAFEDFEFTNMERRDTSMQYLAMDDTKARTDLGWNPNREIKNEILKYK
ncbi:NAD(P)-dependent oxidoreductase [Reichenbachiella agarivorans]|uniref:NAD(P)-dependent oxidoreductase n=1 Tax=Reichenbachiella agarivorans TaxID=2979464 RepID=A0ABY6CXI9_9BACT|nr:NAD(P)-dependent oxidoreductase [Reichenbachiella agarivorans]UXP32940.1 NAD(P)-dependent oxidoreductase [Reichenbachiella agarivorans]